MINNDSDIIVLKKQKRDLQNELDQLRKRRYELKIELDSEISLNYVSAMNEFISINKKLNKIRDELDCVNKNLMSKNEIYKSWVYGYFKV